MSAPTLSVVLCNYNHSEYLSRAIEAIATQSRPPDEFIILDDGSTDNSLEIIKAAAAQHPFIKVLENGRNLGLMASIPIAQAATSGDYLYWAAADDFVLPGFFERAMALAAQYPQAGIVCGQISVIGPAGEEIYTDGIDNWREPLFAPPDMFWRDYVSVNLVAGLAAASIFSRSGFEEVGGFRGELGIFSDSFTLRALGLRRGVAYTPTPVVTFHIREGFSTGQIGNPRLMLEVMARAEAVMRSEEFADLFPDEYIARWRRSWERTAFTAYVVERRRPLGKSFAGLWVGRLLHALMRLKVAAIYGGDCGRYLNAQARRASRLSST